MSKIKGLKKLDPNENENQFTGLGDNLIKKEVSKWVIFTGANGKFYFHLTADNGEIICQSEAYETKQGARKGIDSIRRNVDSEIFEVVVTLSKIEM